MANEDTSKQRSSTLYTTNAVAAETAIDASESTSTNAAKKLAPTISPSRKSSSVAPSTKLCRYGNQCRRKSTCRFVHPSAAPGSNDSSLSKNASGRIPCPHGIKCWTLNCRKEHPPGWNPKANSPRNTTTRHPGNYQPKQATTRQQASPTKNPPGEHVMETGFYAGPLREADSKGYRAAGILLLRRRRPLLSNEEEEAKTEEGPLYEARSSLSSSSSNVQVLLCAEVRKKKLNSLELNLLGGKIETADEQNPKKTAAREFWEETGQLASLASCEELVGLGGEEDSSVSTISDNSVLPIWCGPGKYVLYVTNDVDHDDDGIKEQDTGSFCPSPWGNLTHQYAKVSAAGALPKGAEPEYLVWVDWELILSHCQSQRSKNAAESPPCISIWIPSDTASESEPASLALDFSKFTRSILKDRVVQQAVESVIQRMVDSNKTPANPANDMELVSSALSDMTVDQKGEGTRSGYGR